MRWRFIFLLFFFGGLYALLIFKIYNLQLKNGDYYSERAEAQQRAGGELESIRGNIYFTDKNNNLIPAVLNKEYPEIYAVPKEIQGNNNNKEYAERLSPIINISVEELDKKFRKPNDLYELLVQKAEPEQVNRIKELNLKGIYIKNQLLRFYPAGNLASHVLGFIGPMADKDELAGRYGIELYFNDLLAGKSGQAKGDTLIKPEDGKNLVLTIDRSIQAQAEETLNNLIKKYSAIGGTVIVQEPATGKILAMGSFPNFDPNNYSASEIGDFLNPAVQSVYEPGSVFKLFTMAAGIDSGKITPETTYYDSGLVTFNGRTIQNWDLKAYGTRTMTEVIENSINTGAVFAERKTGHDIFYNYLIKFKLNEFTGIDLPGEVKGSIENLKNGRDINFATASFGQGVSVTPIELINTMSAIANGGVLMKPYILADGSPKTIQRIISVETSKAVAKMMVSAVKKNVIADIPNYSVAGKTGTAFVPDFEKGGYTDDVINTYIGFAPALINQGEARPDSSGRPASAPKFIILIKIDKPAGAPLAGMTVVPAFRELAQFILNYYNIAPDEL
ncbi:MAG: penicillin-binding protein 2 [Patescibacteria group bacterium]